MKKNYHLYLDTNDPTQKAAYEVLKKATNKKNLICRALLCYAKEHPDKVTGAAAKAAERLLNAEASTLKAQEEMATMISDGKEELLERIQMMEETLMTVLQNGAVVVAKPAEEESEPEEEEDDSVIRRINRKVAPTEEELKEQAQGLDPIAQQFMMGFG